MSSERGEHDRGGGDRDRPRTGTLFEPTLISSFGGGSPHDAAAAFKRGSAASSSADRRQDRGIGPGAAPASLPMARNDSAAASSNHGGSKHHQQQHGKKGQHAQQQQHHNAQQQSKKGGAGAAKPPAFVMPTRILSKPTEAALVNGAAAASPVPSANDGAAASSSIAASTPAPAAVPPPVVIKTAAGLPALLYHRPVELFDARGKLVGGDALMALLSDSAATPSSSTLSAPAPFPCDFTVFGAVGTQFSGRSTVLNALARPHSSAPRSAASAASSSSAAPRDPTFIGGDSTRPDGFEIASYDQMLVGSSVSAASGIQVLVTPERNILVDTPPLDAASTLTSMLGEKQASGAALPSSATAVEIAFQLQTLQTMLLLLGSCHVLLVTCESHTLLPMCRLLQRALLLRQHLPLDSHFLSSRAAPASSSAAASNAPPNSSSYNGLPEIVFVINKQPLRELCHPLAGSALSEASVIAALFREQPFRVSTFRPPPSMQRSNAAGATAAAATSEVVNCFQLPFCPETAAGAASLTSQLTLALHELTFQLLTLPKLPASGRASERDWLRHVTRTWQSLQVAPVLAEWRAALQKAAPRPLPIAVAVRSASSHRGSHGQHNKHASAQQKAATATAAPAASMSSSSAAASSSASSSSPHPPRGSKKPQHHQPQSQSSRSESSQHDRSVHGVQSTRKLYEPPGS